MKITIVGGGFGGVKTALELAKHKHNRITLISDKEDFQYYPALFSTATGKSHMQSWVPLGTIFADKPNVDVLLDTVVKINPKTKTLTGKAGVKYEYDNLVLALGAVTTYFGIEGLDHFSYGIKSEAEIRKLKRHLFQQMGEQGITDKRYVIIGGGPTGVELAAALGSYIKRLQKHYGIQEKKVRISLVEGSPRLLPRMNPKTSEKVRQQLEKIGVNVELGKKVESATADGIVINGKPLKSHTVIWTSGVANHPFFRENEKHFEFAPNGKVIVNKYMQTKDRIYIIGDNAATPFSGLAQTALHDAIFVAKNFQRRQANKPLKPYKAVLPPVVVPVGENWAVFEWRKLRLSGWLASLIRRAADVVGYNDILPIGWALGVWRSQQENEEDYFTPTTAPERE